jgi:hypothetical protein
MRNFDTLIVHASATPPDWMAGQGVKAKRDEIDRWHKGRGWAGIGYHYVIDRDGSVTTGRHLNKTGAHVKGNNTGSVGICLIGGRWPDGRWGLATDDFADHFTPEQDMALRDLITDLCERYPRIAHIKGHNDYTDAKGCPCFRVDEWLRGGRVAAPRPNTVATRPKPQPAAPAPSQRPSGLSALFRRILLALRGDA